MTKITPYHPLEDLANQNNLMRQTNPSFNSIPANLPPGQYLIFPDGSGNEPIYHLDEAKMKVTYVPANASFKGEGGFRIGLGDLRKTPDIITPNLARLEERLGDEEFEQVKKDVKRLDELGSYRTVVFAYDENKKPVLINEIYQDLPVRVNGITITQNFKYELNEPIYNITIGNKIEFCYVRIEKPTDPVIITP